MYSRKLGVSGLKIVTTKLVVAYAVFDHSSLGDILLIFQQS